MLSCSECGAELATPLVCLSCNALLARPAGHRVSPFEDLGIDPDWQVDHKLLKKQLLRFSRAVHPDYFATAPEPMRNRAEQASAALNSAFEILKDDFLRADWLVTDLGGPTESEERQMPQVFLMQVMDWNEVLEDASGAAQGSAQWQAMEALDGELASERDGRFATIAQQLSPLPAAGSADLSNTRKELNAVRYIDRTQREIKRLQLQATLA